MFAAAREDEGGRDDGRVGAWERLERGRRQGRVKQEKPPLSSKAEGTRASESSAVW